MSTPQNALPADAVETAPAPRAPRALYWSVQRELWENRSIYVAPLIAAGVVLIGFLISVIHPLGNVRAVSALPPAEQAWALVIRLRFAGAPLILVGGLVAVFYCLDALHGERRDRSILFWKSLPVSDFTTVLSKATIPLVVLPLLTFAIVVVLQLVMLGLGVAVLAPGGLDVADLWARLPLLHMSGLLLYGLFALVLWHAPIYAWLLLVSGWAPRMTFLWAVLPPLALCVVERIAFGTTRLWSVLIRRLNGGFDAAFTHTRGLDPLTAMPDPAPLKFLTSPSVWIGLAIAAVLFVAAVRQRRYRGPI
jgi:ABC-2 type transport system permease protein